jgi:hypothetical protein
MNGLSSSKPPGVRNPSLLLEQVAASDSQSFRDRLIHRADVLIGKRIKRVVIRIHFQSRELGSRQ